MVCACFFNHGQVRFDMVCTCFLHVLCNQVSSKKHHRTWGFNDFIGYWCGYFMGCITLYKQLESKVGLDMINPLTGGWSSGIPCPMGSPSMKIIAYIQRPNTTYNTPWQNIASHCNIQRATHALHSIHALFWLDWWRLVSKISITCVGWQTGALRIDQQPPGVSSRNLWSPPRNKAFGLLTSINPYLLGTRSPGGCHWRGAPWLPPMRFSMIELIPWAFSSVLASSPNDVPNLSG